MRRTSIATAIALVLGAPVHAQPAPAEDAQVPLTYVGANARVSLGIDEHGDVQGEALGIFGFDGDSAWIGELWKGQGSAGGVQFDYHWLLGGLTRQDTIDRPGDVRVAKAFVAFDQNVWHDRKASVGVGYEKNDFFVDGYLSFATSGARRIDTLTEQTSHLLSGVENGHAWTQTETVTTITDVFAHPYEHGIGVRLGRYFDEPLMRLRGGLDYERGKYGADQIGVSLGIDKYIPNSGWSFSLEGEHIRKTGDYETDTSDDRVWLLARYEFGQSFRPVQPTRAVQVERAVPDIRPAPPQVVRNEVRLDADAFFDFDRATLRAEAKAALDGLLGQLASNRRVSRVSVIGHTDSIGPDDYNQALSERRAKAVHDYLAAHGIAADEIAMRGEGERNPTYPNDTPANRQKNRRVDIDFLTIEESTVSEPTPAPTRSVVWIREPVAVPAAWIERALRNPAAHKRSVDVYRFERSSTATTHGDRQYANRPPVAVDDGKVLESCPLSLNLNVLANDSDPDGDPLTVIAAGTGQYGTTRINADGSITYTANAGDDGRLCGLGDSFTYTIRDSFGATATATVRLTPLPRPNRAPLAHDDAASTAIGTPVRIDVLANDSDPDGDALVLEGAATPAHGSVATNADGSLTYTPAPGFEGSDSFAYTVSDGHGGKASAKVTVTVGTNRPPLALDDSVAVLKGYGRDIDVLANDSDPDGDRLRVIAVEHTSSMTATVSINADGTVRYQHSHGTQGPDTFRYTITDDHGHTATATVHVLVNEIVL